MRGRPHAKRLPGEDDDRVQSRHAHRFTLELRPGPQPSEGSSNALAGTITDEHGRTIRFDGWLGLASALERQLADAAGHEGDLDRAQRESGATSV